VALGVKGESKDSAADRCGGSAGSVSPWRTATSLLPVELRHVNHGASTNGQSLRHGAQAEDGIASGRRPGAQRTPYNCPAMSMDSSSPFDRIAERVERLLVRQEQFERTITLLTDQVATLTQERDSLRSRLQAARARVDALIERLPSPPAE
jgi:hypothetical protein